MELQVGDRVVHPRYGVGRVVGFQEREFEPGMMRTYYEVSLPGTTLWVSLDMPTFGLRKLTGRGEISLCRKILAAHPAPLIEDPRQRQSEMADRLKLGTLRAHCEVVRDLYAYFGQKSPSSRMGAFLQVAQDVLCQEWAAVEGVTLLDAAKEINTLLEESRETLQNKE